jgi:hypothetical protein
VALQIVVNRQELFKEQVPAEPWERTFPLKDIDLGKAVVLEVVSDTFVPPNAADGSALGVQVRGIRLLSRLEDPANQPLGCKWVSGVKEEGFRGQDYDRQDQPARWTNGNARLVIPVDRQNPPRALHVKLFPWRPAQASPASLQIIVNRRPLVSEQVPRDTWERTLDLTGIDLGEEMVLEILSDTFIPRDHDGGADARAHGVQVLGIRLLPRTGGTPH